jgi:hypothetical protein
MLQLSHEYARMTAVLRIWPSQLPDPKPAKSIWSIELVRHRPYKSAKPS